MQELLNQRDICTFEVLGTLALVILALDVLASDTLVWGALASGGDLCPWSRRLWLSQVDPLV